MAGVNSNSNKINRVTPDIILPFFFFSNKMDTGGRSKNIYNMYSALVNANRIISQVVRKAVKNIEISSNLYVRRYHNKCPRTTNAVPKLINTRVIFPWNKLIVPKMRKNKIKVYVQIFNGK